MFVHDLVYSPATWFLLAFIILVTLIVLRTRRP
jgi:hypothetical protein